MLFGVILLQESRKERLVLVTFSVTGESVIFLFFCLFSTEGGVPKLTSACGEMGMSSPLLLLLRSEMVWPSRRYSVTLGRDDVGLLGVCLTGLLLLLLLAEGSSGRSNWVRSHHPSGSCSQGKSSEAAQEGKLSRWHRCRYELGGEISGVVGVV